MSVGRYAVIPTRSRVVELERAVAAVAPQADRVVGVLNREGMPPAIGGVDWTRCTEQPPNISRLWNLGLAKVARLAQQNGHIEWDVAVLNDDAVVPPGWFEAVAGSMRAWGGAAACSNLDTNFREVMLWVEPKPVNLFHRLTGFAFVLRGELGLRADEDLGWWYGDDDLDWRSRQLGGTVIVPGYPVQHLTPNAALCGALAEQAGRDRETFAQKWGQTPW